MESARFTQPVRAQLTTTATKQCTYFATDEISFARVFVKGPYLSNTAAQVGPQVAQFKRQADPEISLAEIELIQCVPDGMPDCQFGARQQVDLAVPRWFQVAPSLLPERAYPLPVKSKSSKSAWQKPVEVVDWDKLPTSHVRYAKEWEESIYVKDPTAAWEFVRHIILCRMCGCGADLAYSNFVYNPVGHRVTQVDHEDWAKVWSLSDTCVCSPRTQAAAHFKRFLRANESKVNAWLAQVLSRVKPPVVSFRDVEDVLADIKEPVPANLKRRGPGFAQAMPIKRIKTAAPAVAPAGDPSIFRGQADPRYRVGCDPWGFSLSLRKSDLQKAIRRGDLRQALVAFYACFNMPLLFPNKSSAKASQTNILNRVMICAMEDIGVANPQLVHEVTSKVFAMTAGKAKCDGEMMGRLIHALCLSKKVRIQSHLTHAYGSKNREAALAAGLTLRDEPFPSLEDPNWFNVAERDPMRVWVKLGVNLGGSKAFQPLLARVYAKVAQNNKRAVLQYALAEAHFKALGKIPGPTPFDPPLVLPEIPQCDLPALKNMLEAPPKEEAYDIHTSEGKRYSDKLKFRSSGAKVSNLDLSIHSPILERIYINSNY
jgi:hypothetical protein